MEEEVEQLRRAVTGDGPSIFPTGLPIHPKSESWDLKRDEGEEFRQLTASCTATLLNKP
jgi:hypothetical protein